MRRSLSLLLLSLALLAAGCKSRQVRVTASGSSTVFPITEAMAEEFGKVRSDIRVTVGIAGTGGGFKKFCAGETDISDASRPIRPVEVEACDKGQVQYVELPVAYDGIAVVVNPRNDWAKEITVEELKKLWEPAAQGKVLKWSQVRAGWPDKEIHLFGPGVDSGTYDYFTEAVVGREHSSRGDYTAAVDPNVLVRGVAEDPLGLGFFSMAYFHENKERLRALPVDDQKEENGAGPVAPSVETVRNNSYQPLSRPIFVYVAIASLQRPEVKAFTDFYFTDIAALVDKVGYVPLPDRAYQLDRERLAKRVTGSIFGGKGSQVGLSVEQLLEKAQALAAP